MIGADLSGVDDVTQRAEALVTSCADVREAGLTGRVVRNYQLSASEQREAD